jgi:hypothetical protein
MEPREDPLVGVSDPAWGPYHRGLLSASRWPPSCAEIRILASFFRMVPDVSRLPITYWRGMLGSRSRAVGRHGRGPGPKGRKGEPSLWKTIVREHSTQVPSQRQGQTGCHWWRGVAGRSWIRRAGFASARPACRSVDLMMGRGPRGRVPRTCRRCVYCTACTVQYSTVRDTFVDRTQITAFKGPVGRAVPHRHGMVTSIPARRRRGSPT